MPEPVKIFLAHASEDKEAIRNLRSKLLSHGFKPWLDEVDLLPGQNWHIEIPKAIKASDIFIACLSQQSVQKQGYVQKEFRLALDTYAEKPVGTIYLIPLKLDDCNIPDIQLPQLGVSFRDIQWLDFWKPDGFDRLLKAIAAIRADSNEGENQIDQKVAVLLSQIKQASQVEYWDSVIEIAGLIFKDVASNSVVTTEIADVYHLRGDAYYKTRKYNEAIDDLTKAIQLEPNISDYYFKRGIVFLRAKQFSLDIGDYDKAITDFYQAIRITPDNSDYHAFLGGCFQEKRLFEKAILEFDIAINLDPGNYQQYTRRAAAYYDKGDKDRALADVSKALSLNSTNGRAYHIRGRILEDLGYVIAPQLDYQLAISYGETSATKDLEILEDKQGARSHPNV